MNSTCNNHSFNFDGGDKLQIMGASWFTSYSWYLFFDKNHDNFKNVSSWQNRIITYNETRNYHKFWLEQIVTMN